MSGLFQPLASISDLKARRKMSRPSTWTVVPEDGAWNSYVEASVARAAMRLSLTMMVGFQ